MSRTPFEARAAPPAMKQVMRFCCQLQQCDNGLFWAFRLIRQWHGNPLTTFTWTFGSGPFARWIVDAWGVSTGHRRGMRSETTGTWRPQWNNACDSLVPTCTNGQWPDTYSRVLSSKLPTPDQFRGIHNQHLQNPPEWRIIAARCVSQSGTHDLKGRATIIHL